MKTLFRQLFLILLFAHIAMASERSEEFMNVIVAPQQELIVVQWKHINTEDLLLFLKNKEGKIIQETTLSAGTTIAYFDTQALYSGEYEIQVTNGKESITHSLTLTK